MITKNFTMVLGAVLFLIGVMGFFPDLSSVQNQSDLAIGNTRTYGLLFNVFPVNVLLSIVHMSLGLWAMFASQNILSSKVFCRANAIIFGVLAIMGLIPNLNTVFGLMPIYGNNIWLHGIVALSCTYFGWTKIKSIKVNQEKKFPRAA